MTIIIMKVVIIGGHLSPALSVLEALPKDTRVLFIGRKYALEGDSALSLEYRAITPLSIPFVVLNTALTSSRPKSVSLISGTNN